MGRPNWKATALIAGLLVVIVSLSAPTRGADQRHLVATIEEPFEFNGELYPPGRLSVREIRDFTPTRWLSEIWVGHECLGLFEAALTTADGRERRNTMTFERTREGHLRLVGFSKAGQGEPLAYRFLTARSPDPRDGAELARR
jgi:hypothetical protein